MIYRCNRLHDEYEFHGNLLDLTKFWEISETLPIVISNGREIHESVFLKQRFNMDGSIKNTFTKIAEDFNLTYNQAYYKVHRALWHMRHPKRYRKFMNKSHNDRMHSDPKSSRF